MRYRYQSGTMIYEVSLERHGEGYRVTVNGEAHDLEVLDAQPGAISLRFKDGPGPFRPEVVYWGAEGGTKWLSWRGCTYRLERPAERGARYARSAPRGGAEDSLRAPMPAQVRSVLVAEGDTVAVGQALLLLEAMKMEIRVQSPRAGQVARLLVKPGDQVKREQVLVELVGDR
jgi:acetyl/propionyl-CoA carboxylase alpha subunit